MLSTGEWTTIAVPKLRSLPRPVFLRSQNLAPHERFPLHTHDWNQFVYATSGTLTVTVLRSRYVITPEQAIWVPAGVLHTTGTFSGAEFRNLYVTDSPDLGMPDRCTVYAVSGLLRALIAELDRIDGQSETDAYLGKLNDLMVEQLRRLAEQDFHLPWPQRVQLRRLCETLYDNPADTRSLDDWGKELGASGRTLARHFEKEMGITLREWRYKLRLFLALEWLGAGRNVTEIALDLGYASTSAFTYMFRREMGCPPSEWRGG